VAHITPAAAGGPVVICELRTDVDALTAELVERILTNDYAYAEATRLEHAELATACHDNLCALLAAICQDDVPLDTSVASAAGRLKAQRDIPLAALLHAYRLGGRLIWEKVIARSDGSDADALPLLAARMWAAIDEMSSVAADAYAEAMADRARSDAQTRQLMLRALLHGEIQERTHIRESLRVLRLAEHGSYLVVCVEDRVLEADPLGSAEQTFLRRGLSSQWIGELRSHVGLVALPEKDHVGRALAILESMATARIGVSLPFDSPELAHQAFQEAQLAMLCATPGSTSVTVYGDRVTALLLARAPEGARDLARGVLGSVLELPDHEAETLLGTLSCWFDCAGSASAVAERLHFHRNTIHQRLRRIEQLTGRTCSNPAEAAELYLALQSVQLGHA
jgi:hypothetical protein